MRLLSEFEMVGRTQAAVIAWLLLGSLSVEAIAEGVPDALRQAWQRRQDTVKTARFEWQSTCEERPAQTPEEAANSKVVPELVSFQFPGIFLLDGNKCRYSTRQLDLLTATPNPTEGQYLSTFDGRRSMHLNSGKAKSMNFGVIHAAPEYRDIHNVHLLALTLSFRPLDSRFHERADLSHYALISNQEAVNGRNCILLRERTSPSGNGLVKSLFVDPARDYVVVRYVSEVNGKRSIQLDITYAEDGTIGWAPSGWNHVWLNRKGDIISRSSAEVTDHAINERLSENLFVIDFPSGTFVDDRSTGSSYLVRSGGEKRPIMPVEVRRGASWEQIMATEPGKAGLRQDWISRRTLIVAVVAFLALCAAILFVRRWRST